MSGLRDPRLEIFAREYARLKAAGTPASQAAVDAAVEARYKGYQNPSKTFAANARKKAQRKDVKARVAELLAPKTEQAEREIEATKEWAEGKLVKIINYDLGEEAVKIDHQLKSMELLAKFRGWLAPEQHKHDVGESLAQVMRDIDGRTRGLPLPQGA